MFLTRTSTPRSVSFSLRAATGRDFCLPLLQKAASMGLLYKRVVGVLLSHLGLMVMAPSPLLGRPVEIQHLNFKSENVDV